MEKLSTTTTIFLTALSAACTPQKAQRKPTQMPGWLSEECVEARGKYYRVLGEGSNNTKEVTRIIHEIKEACGVVLTEEGQVLGVILEDVADEIAHPRITTSATCTDILANFDLLPRVCGIPDVSILMDKCGRGYEHGPWYHAYRQGFFQTRWNNQDFENGEPGETFQFSCWDDTDVGGIEIALDRVGQKRYGFPHEWISHLVFRTNDGKYRIQAHGETMDEEYNRHLHHINLPKCTQKKIKKFLKRLRFCHR